MILNMLIWYAAQKKLSGSLILSDEDVDEAEIREKYKYVVKGNREKERLKYSIIGCIFGVTAILLGNTVGMTAAGAAGAAAIWMLTQEKRKYKHAEKYKYVVKGNREKERLKYSIIGCIFGVTAILLGNTVGMTAAGAAGAAAIWMLTQEKRKYKHARKRVLREVEKQFPEWLMNLSLQLQTDNVHVSLKKTIPDAPFILKQDLTRLVEEIEQQPNALQPYLRFMREFQIPDVLSAMKILYSMAEFGIGDMGGQIDALVQRNTVMMDIPDVLSAMKILYSMAEFGIGDMGGQIDALVQRNTVMMDRAERLKEEDLMAGVGFLVLLPMITGVVKMLADLVLVILGILSVVNTI